MKNNIRIEKILEGIGGRPVVGNINLLIDGFNLCNRLTKLQRIISYVTNETYINVISENKSIVCIFVKPEYSDLYSKIIIERGGALVISNNPENDFYSSYEYIIEHTDFYEKYDFSTFVGKGCKIHSTAVINTGVQIGNYVIIGANSVICPGTIIKDNVTIGCNTVIGADGFQIVKPEGIPINISHVGSVFIDEGVFIGNCVSISKSLFEGSTHIGKNVKIDSLTSIAHNCDIEENTVITACVTICGSVIIKKNTWIAPNSSILNRVIIGENAVVGISSLVLDDVEDNAVIWGSPARRHR